MHPTNIPRKSLECKLAAQDTFLKTQKVSHNRDILPFHGQKIQLCNKEST